MPPSLRTRICSLLIDCSTASCQGTLCSLVQKHFMSTPRIRLKADRALDAVAARDKALRPIFRIRGMILRQDHETIKISRLELRRRDMGLKTKNTSVAGYMKRYPNIFEIYTNPLDCQPWCRLTKEMLELLDEESRIHREQEPQLVEKLRKLLMMANDRRIRADKLELARDALGLPHDFLTRLVPHYPQFFRLVGKGHWLYLELVAWDDSLAVSEFEKRAKNKARQKGLGEIETRGQPLAFKMSFSPGMLLRKKNLEILDKWQKLPYISPYQDWSWVHSGTALSDKRVVALLHEVLCLTVEKKILVGDIGSFRKEFGLPQSVAKLSNRYPGIFYMSLRGAVQTVILREGYRQSNLIEDHPLVNLKEKYAQMEYAGPRLVSSQSKLKEELGDGNATTHEDGDVGEIDEDSMKQTEMSEDSIDSEGEGSDVDYCFSDHDSDEDNENIWRSSKKTSSTAKRETC